MGRCLITERDYHKSRSDPLDCFSVATPIQARRRRRLIARMFNFWFKMARIEGGPEAVLDAEMAEYWDCFRYGYSHGPATLEDIRKIIDDYGYECQ